MTSIQPFFTPAEKGRALWHMGALVEFMAVGEETDGQFWLAQQTGAKGFASPLHQHSREDELFFVMDGELAVHVGDEVFAAEAGAAAFAPRGLPHAFRVVSPTARFLVFSNPAGFEGWFFETGETAGSLVVPPPLEGPPDIGRMISTLAAYGVDLLGPPPQ